MMVKIMKRFDIGRVKQIVKQLGEKYAQIKSIYLFGSVARGDADDKSDLDLFFFWWKGVQAGKCVRL
ncbi:MAG: nucleotidyltransferase family protein [Promethearchaeota archaeon]